MGEGAGEELRDTEAVLDDAAAESKGGVAVPVIIDPDTVHHCHRFHC